MVVLEIYFTCLGFVLYLKESVITRYNTEPIPSIGAETVPEKCVCGSNIGGRLELEESSVLKLETTDRFDFY